MRGQRIEVAPIVLQLLDAFGKPRTVQAVVSTLAGYDLASVKRAIATLTHLGFLLPAADRKSRRDVAAAWKDSFAAAHFHFATRDLIYLREPAQVAQYLTRRFHEGPQPSSYKEFVRHSRVALAADGSGDHTTLDEALRLRRTVREFSRRPVPVSALAKVVRGTWGQTGTLDGGVLGPLLVKTSPSAGARHPIECYVLAWRVKGLTAGVYHFNVRKNCLERLRRGDHRQLAVQMAGGQTWIRGAAFLCVMTAVADRTFWKYASADAYRLFLLDAGHLAQTFVLLATAAGLGAFTTAALSEKRIERALDLDGIREFPVYLCGAGTKRVRASGPPSSSR